MTTSIFIKLLHLMMIMMVVAKDDNFRPKPQRAGPWVEATRGAIWPKPFYQISRANYFNLDPNVFKFQLNDFAASCPVLSQSLSRYFARAFPGEIRRRDETEIVVNTKAQKVHPKFSNKSHRKGVLDILHVNLESTEGCETIPHLRMNESYVLNIEPLDEGDKSLTAGSVWGLLRGLESFTQLIFINQDDGYLYQINSTYVVDMPRFPHRGFMVDTSRHFLSKKSILQTLDLMEMNKMNVFHWHVTDDNSFPFQSLSFPSLSEKGSYDPKTHVYTPQDVEDIIFEAALRGIRVIPEFDTPGHTLSWELGLPGLLTPCYDETGKESGFYGPMDPTKEYVYSVMDTFIDEIKNRFPDEYIHVGGDEVAIKCWASNRFIHDVMAQWNITGNYRKLESYFIERILQMVEKQKPEKSSIVWQEVFDNGDQIYPGTMVQVWKDWGIGWRNSLSQVTKSGYFALLSAPWYLNYISYGSDWYEMYEADPHDFNGTQDDKDFVLGGEACIWGEFVNTINLIPRSWPRASAVAEKLWSSLEVLNDAHEAAPRLQEHECRMLARGYPVQPVVGAGYCPVVWD